MAKTGKKFDYVMPSVNKECMQIFLNEMSAYIQNEIIIVMDNAGWHKGLDIPKNMTIMFLPAYSPELNPSERMWQYIKDNILKSQLYENLDLLENTLIDFINGITADTIMSVCNCSYIAL